MNLASARRQVCLTAVAALLAHATAWAAVAGSSAPEVEAAATCTLEPGPIRTVTRVIDGETLTLDDGSEVRLIGALAPRATDASAAAGAWPPELAAKEALARLALGQRVALAYGGQQRDRYGRHLAHVFVLDKGLREWLQGTLLAGGAARAYVLPGQTACGAELLAHETQARDQKLGLWSNGVYRVKEAAKTGVLASLRGRYELVGGVVQSVSPTSSATYLNFGSDWRTDFTARIGKPVLARQPDLAALLPTLKGRAVVVRGWLDRRNGPLIDVIDASQIDVTDAEPAASPSASAAPPAPSVAPARAPQSLGDDAAPNEQRPAPEKPEPGAVGL